MRLLYPKEWESNTYTKATVIFEEAYGYKEFEGPVEGSPTILSVVPVGENDHWKQLRIETNAGYREVYCSDVYLKFR